MARLRMQTQPMMLVGLVLSIINGSALGGVQALAASPLSAELLNVIAHGGVAVHSNWIAPDLVSRLRCDAEALFHQGLFSPDGLTNQALAKSQQGFSKSVDRQTFRGDAWMDESMGDFEARLEFAKRMKLLRAQLSIGLNRPTLEAEGRLKHEMTYNWYEPGAKLGRHLDEHHEETKGLAGWQKPSRRSVTWLVYLNDDWTAEEGGALRCFPRTDASAVAVGSHEGNLQIGWTDHVHPVFLDAWRSSGQCALYRLDERTLDRDILSAVDFDVPRQPIDFASYLRETNTSFEQISTARLDPRFAGTRSGPGSTRHQTPPPLISESFLEVVPVSGTLVLFDSVTMPHLVQEVTASRQRVAATGWFHEDSQWFGE